MIYRRAMKIIAVNVFELVYEFGSIQPYAFNYEMLNLCNCL